MEATVTDRSRDTHPAAEAGAMRKLGSESGESQRSVAGAGADSFWRKRFPTLPYVDAERGYEYYRPAFRYGWESRTGHEDRNFHDVESELRDRWDAGRTGLAWDEARPAVRDAYETPTNTEWSDPGNPLA
jgi:hypothetical protein